MKIVQETCTNHKRNMEESCQICKHDCIEVQQTNKKYTLCEDFWLIYNIFQYRKLVIKESWTLTTFVVATNT